MPIRFPVPTLILMFGVVWMAYGAPVRWSELFNTPVEFHTREPLTFGSMRSGDVVAARYKSTGCYHRTTARLTFRRTVNGGIEVSVYAKDGGSFLEFGILRRRLSWSEAAALDHVMRIHRTAQTGGCTTVSTLQMMLYDGGKQLAAYERVSDFHCMIPGFESLVYEALEGGVW